jgi:hypothetical protein
MGFSNGGVANADFSNGIKVKTITAIMHTSKECNHDLHVNSLLLNVVKH